MLPMSTSGLDEATTYTFFGWAKNRRISETRRMPVQPPYRIPDPDVSSDLLLCLPLNGDAPDYSSRDQGVFYRRDEHWIL
jgi:hypothetical protein